MNLSGLVCFLRRSLLQLECRIIQASGLDRQFAPALAVHGPSILPQPHEEQEATAEPSFLDNVFWMAAPKKRRTIEINRTRRRDPSFMLKVKTNIEPCVECGHLKQKHILCGFCYEKIRKETALIRGQIKAMEGRPLNTPAQETLVLYDSESPGESDKDKRIVERNRKRPSWFSIY
ncbi:large ribosomal subunit protein bL32m [Salmo salar]|uniref:Large ribosomal subunit protein bL32m n=1 Tax=Salmo salar TaxID=8030 RepID=B5X599_SALSA|nr:39S ribosomal protein L32, mitochondrial [Salmo salar]ACI66019.1 39S ribosomal protein L32, mitochondrial precursor [Salmo salar]ACM09690.1 39S ribosomal protein L32, mitochondrial precursor [Salmo salar]ADM16280.1 39S ribosomal protein L32, mitochondrial precursor [Salmo salar]